LDDAMTPEENERDAKDQSMPKEPDEAAAAAERVERDAEPPAGGKVKPSKESRPLDLEPPEGEKPAPDRARPSEEADERSSSGVRALDVCPNCGSPMRGRDTLVCMRCGFDLKTMKVIETKTGATTVDEDEKAQRPPLVKEGPGDPWLPLVLAIIGAAILLIGCLAGAPGLFPHVRATLAEGATLVISWDERWGAAARFPILILLWTMCGFGSLIAGAWLFGRPMGNVGLGALRMLGIVAIAHCVSFISFSWRLGEFLVESLLAAAVFFILTTLLFRVKPRDAATILVVTIVLFLALFVIGHVVTWVT
jgi:hypothetical protein